MFQSIFTGTRAVARRVTGCALGAMFALLTLAPPASAVEVTVGMVTYDIQFFPFGSSFDDNGLTSSDPLQNTPWWNNATLAQQVANAYLADIGVGGSPFTDNPSEGTSLIFSYEFDSGFPFFVNHFEVNEGIPSFPIAPSVQGGDSFRSTGLSNAVFAFAAPTSIPEINAGSLAQVLFILLALHLWVRGRARAQQGRRVQP